MKQIFRIFLRDCRRLRKNVIALIVVMGLGIIPALYAWFNIAANWDPYSSTAGIQVAVANEDKGFSGTALQGELHAGAEVVNQLKANKDIGWQFVNQDTAVEGVKSGRYYAAIVIPADFSERLTSILTGSIENPKLTYYTNEKKNAVAPKITDKGASTVQQEINSTFISVVTRTAATALNKLSGDLSQDKRTVMDRFVTALQNTAEDLGQFSAMVDAFGDTAEAVQGLLNTAKASLPDIDKMARQGNQALDSAKGVLQASRTSINNVTNTFGQVVDATQGLYDKVSGGANAAFGTIEGDAEGAAVKLDNIAAEARRIIQVNSGSITVLQQLNAELPKPLDTVKAMIQRLEDANRRQQAIVDRVSEAAKTVRGTKTLSQNTRQGIAAIVQQSSNDIAALRSAYRNNVQPQLDSLLNSLTAAGSSISGLFSGAQNSLSHLDSVLDGVGKSMSAAQKALQSTKRLLDSSSDKLRKMVDQLQSVGKDEQLQKLIELLQTDPGIAGSFMSAPVQLETKSFYVVKNYGSAMAPFYSSLAIWVGGIVLVAIMKVRVDEDQTLRGLKPYQCYMGRYLLFLCLGLVQATIVCLGDLFFLEIQCKEPLLFMIAGWVSSFVYVNIIYALTVSFGDIGKALSVILLVIQIAGSGGTFPIEVTPAFFQHVYPLLPFTYGINAMRECVAGVYQQAYLHNILSLLAFVPIALLLGLVLRKPLIRLNHFFERRLEETHLL